MTQAVFFPAAARAGIVWLGLGDGLLQAGHFFPRQDVHHLVGVAPAAQQVGHHAHRAVDVVEEQLVAGAQVVQPGLAVRRVDEAVAGQPPWQAKRTSHSRQ